MTLEELQARHELLKKGSVSPFWAEIRGVLYGQLLSRRNAIVSLQIRGLEAAFEAAALQAEIGILQFVMNLPSFLLKDVEEDIKNAIERERGSD